MISETVQVIGLASEEAEVCKPFGNNGIECKNLDGSHANAGMSTLFDKNHAEGNTSETPDDGTMVENVQDGILSKKARIKGEMTMEDIYNNADDLDEDEDDIDWEPFRKHMEVKKWFCANCTMVNLDHVIHCDICGEHKESGIVKYGFFASPYLQEGGLSEAVSEVIDRYKESFSCSEASAGLTLMGFDERMLLHSEVEKKSLPHPERPDRLRAIAASLANAGIFPGKCKSLAAREITQEELLKAHSLEHIEAVEHTGQMLSSYFTPDTYSNEHSAQAARLAAGLCADLASEIYHGRAKNGFALIRPPGHHAGVHQAMGFCLHNNAAVAALAAQVAGANKVLIVDWDVHHGNGTQEIFEGNRSVLYISLHRHEGGLFYPGTGAAHEVGTEDAEGYCVNVPWSRGGVGDNDYIFTFQHVVLPIDCNSNNSPFITLNFQMLLKEGNYVHFKVASSSGGAFATGMLSGMEHLICVDVTIRAAHEFAPDFTIISAGFDAARGDPLGGCDVTPDGYACMASMLSALCGGKLLVILEGGYNLRSISSSAAAVIKVLLGGSSEIPLDKVEPSRSGMQTVLEVLKIQRKFWPSLSKDLSQLQSLWESYLLQSRRKEARKRRTVVPVWRKWGRKRIFYHLLWQQRQIRAKGKLKRVA